MLAFEAGRKHKIRVNTISAGNLALSFLKFNLKCFLSQILCIYVMVHKNCSSLLNHSYGCQCSTCVLMLLFSETRFCWVFKNIFDTLILVIVFFFFFGCVCIRMYLLESICFLHVDWLVILETTSLASTHLPILLHLKRAPLPLARGGLTGSFSSSNPDL